MRIEFSLVTTTHENPTAPTGPGASSLHVTSPTGWTSRTWLLLLVLCGALFLDALDISMVGVALPSIKASLGMEPAALQWIVSGYVLGYGGLLLLGGRAADLLGRRPVFLGAVLVFGIASVATAFIDVPAVLIALRFVKGVAAAFTVPAGLSIITTTFAEGPARNKAFSIYTVCGASGFSLGLVFGGLLTEVSYRLTLLFPGPVALALVVLGWKVIPKTAPAEKFTMRRFDVAGALTSTGALLILVYTVVQAPGLGWTSATVLTLFTVSALLAVAFVVIEIKHPHPLVRLSILKSVRLVHANLAGFVMFGGYAAFQFLVTLYVQDSLGWSPVAMSLAFLSAGLLVVASATKIDAVLDRVNSTVLVAVGLLAFLGAYAWFLRAEPGASYWVFLFPTILLLGVGFALTFPAVNSQATEGVDDDEQGLASGLLNTFIQVGGAVMMAVVTAITTSGHIAAEPGQLLPGMTTAVAVIVGLTLIGIAGTAAVLGLARPRALTEPDAVAAPTVPRP
ncbi:Major facilitator superfamily MFS_1 OS=Tsukamurella paurometabola (strain ATCC 8368 / DSM /CCUG 35730 / CIP 100753 / JCM 10117 / KCTC 9821 / NBRC 16120/ NCIMB 702349 / NCTC 13040) OX=521096 GN=Tpau_0892 PE=4 SV=1 [Tsukamurella paurometabola]|uniref:Major facilitator superfamily MFS_1 n=1 Tax=Tsukamurella paurometabola (strain ATCC 8368 / DSM 20162 / CCUG 35730 / CIP 100753 / JCM 10117 / KCTC 9821 / NBRC 16120 / NCIMB 702349 / NCTC 13040) TaxID=521096 RepID=D5UUF5_TSUPD|nr:MFS transporter [Tsukamurella paurometabola]ADG77526.1 major facilitator superfamily MFS_1 [Tsukamurella paurometabola DSM 20162]SUP27575.1 Spectinomycin tetracycline efflux pump [Tsukamurella paurometabola]